MDSFSLVSCAVGDCCEQFVDTSDSVQASSLLTRWVTLSGRSTRMTAARNWLVNLVIEVIFTAPTLLCCILTISQHIMGFCEHGIEIPIKS